MTLSLHQLWDAEVTGYDGDGYDLRLPGGFEIRYDPPGGPGPADWEFFGVEPLDEDYLRSWDEKNRELAELKEKWAQSRTAAPTASTDILTRDSTGLYHSADYRVCRDRKGNVHNCSPVAAI